MLMGRFLLQIYIFQRHEQNICCFLFTFAYGLLLRNHTTATAVPNSLYYQLVSFKHHFQ